MKAEEIIQINNVTKRFYYLTSKAWGIRILTWLQLSFCKKTT